MHDQEMIEMSLAAFDTYFCKETGWIHLNHAMPHLSTTPLISLYANFLYAATLLSTHQVAQIEKAVHLLEKIAAFGKEKGYPLYIHNYPYVSYEWAFDFYVIVHFLLTRHQKELPTALYSTLEKAGENLSLCLKSSSRVIDQFLFTSDFESIIPSSFQSSYELGQYIKAIHLLHPQGAKAICHRLISEYWHPFLHCFMGDRSHETYLPDQENQGFFHLYAAYITNTVSSLKTPSIWMEAVYLGKQEKVLPTFSSSLVDTVTYIQQKNKESYLFAKKDVKPREEALLAAEWIVEHKEPVIASLYCKKGEFTSKMEGNRVLCHLAFEEELEMKKVDEECILYFRPHAAIRFYCEGKTTSVLPSGKEIEVFSENKKLFTLLWQSSEKVIAAVRKGKRPSQIGKEQFTAYDTLVSFRRVEEAPFSLSVVITL